MIKVDLKPFVAWVKEDGFMIRGSYDPVTDESFADGPLILLPHQEDILGHCLTQRPDGTLPYTTIIYSAPKKSGKTTIGAAIAAWAANQFPPNSEILCVASSKEHAQGRAFSDIEFDSVRQGRVVKIPTRYELNFEDNTVIKALAQQYKTAAGSRHCMSLWDELWTYTTENERTLFGELTPIKIPGVPISLRVITTYAGFEGESELLWKLYETIVLKGEPVPELAHITKANGDPVCYRNGRMFAYWDTEPRMPWQTLDYYEEQMATLRPHEYLRLHENRWVTTHEVFIPIEWWDEATRYFPTSLEMDFKNLRRKLPVVIGVDAATKQDTTAVVGVQYDASTGTIDLAFHQIRRPTPDEPVDLQSAVETYILELNQQFKVVSIIYDPRELVRSMARLKKLHLPVQEFPQTISNMCAASSVLYDLLREKRLRAYPADDMRKHIQFAVAEDKGQGFRIVKPGKNSRHSVDGAVALAMACYEAIRNHGVDLSKKIRMEHPDSDVSAWVQKTPRQLLEEAKLPLQLRDKDELGVPPGGWD